MQHDVNFICDVVVTLQRNLTVLPHYAVALVEKTLRIIELYMMPRR